jgi:hypothetical protein
MLVSAVELPLAVELEPVLAALLELELLQPAAAIAARQPAATARIALGLRPLARRATLRTFTISHSPLGIFELVNGQILPAVIAAVLIHLFAGTRKPIQARLFSCRLNLCSSAGRAIQPFPFG